MDIEHSESGATAGPFRTVFTQPKSAETYAALDGVGLR